MPAGAGRRDAASDSAPPIGGAPGHPAGVPAPDTFELLERMTDGFIALDRDWRIVYMNAAARGAGDPAGPDVIGKSHWAQWPQTVGTEVERRYRSAMATQQPAHFDHCYTTPGKEFWHRIHAYPDANGLSIFFRDVTEEKRSEDLARLLASASTRFVSTLDLDAMLKEVASLGVPLLGPWACAYLVDESFRVTDVSYAAVDDALRTILRQVVRLLPLHAVSAALPWSRAMQSGGPVLVSEVGDRFYDALGTPELRDFVSALAPQSLLSVPLLARGRVIGGITFGTRADGRRHDERDLIAAREVALPAGLALDTARLYEEQRRARFDAELARRRAEEANNSKVDFLRAMSHEIRTPMNAIGGYVQLLRMGARGPLSPAILRDLERMERNHHHVTRLVNDLLQFAKLEAGRVQFEPRRIGVATLMTELEDFLDPQDRLAHHCTIRACAADVAVWADPDKVTQILVNLISNAVKHTPPGTTIEVFCPEGAEGGRVRIAVRDDGPGIAAEKQAAIFEPFVQVGRTLSHPVEGLGLGLAIARDLARGMGGDLTVKSDGASGVTFVLELPGA